MGNFTWNSNQNVPQLPPLSLFLKSGVSSVNYDSFGYDLRKWVLELLNYLHVPTWDEYQQGNFNPCAWVNIPACGTSALDIYNTGGGGVQIRTQNNNTWLFSDGGDLYIPGAIILPDGSVLTSNGINVTDGTTTINGLKNLYVSGATLSGTSPSGILYVTGGASGNYVPYVSATQNVNLGAYSIYASNIGTWASLNYPTWVSGTSFVKMISGNTFVLDNTNYLSSITSSQVIAALGYTPFGAVNPLPAINGGTGISAVTNGDILYATGNTFAKLTIGTSGQTLASNGTLPVWTTPTTGMTNPMTTLNDIIYGGVSGTPTRLASGTTSTFLQMGTNPQWFDLFNTSNVWGASQNITASISGSPFFGVVITNNTQGSSFSNTGAGIKYVHNLISGFTVAVNSLSAGNIDKTIYNESLFGWSWRANGKNSPNTSNYLWELEGTQESMALLRGASAPHVTLALTTSNGGSGAVRFNFATGGGTSFFYGTSGKTGVNYTAPNSTLHISGSLAIVFQVKNASYTFTPTDYGVIFSGSTAAQTITLPNASGCTGRMYELVNIGSVSVTLGTSSSEIFANVTATPTTLTLAASAGKSIKVVSTGVGWAQLN